MKTKIQQTVNCQNPNCLKQRVHPKTCQELSPKILCNPLILLAKNLRLVGVVKGFNLIE
jgi:hypothetical protein